MSKLLGFIGLGLLVAQVSCPPCPANMTGKIPNCHCVEGYEYVGPLEGCRVPEPKPTPSPSTSPSASPSPSPMPTPEPTPSPSPTPKSTPTPTLCPLPNMPEVGGDKKEFEPDKGPFIEPNAKLNDLGREVWWGRCVETENRGHFYETVVMAQWLLANDRQDLVQCDLNGDKCQAIVEPIIYTRALAALLTSQYGVCATAGGPEDEIGIKNSNGSSEQFDVLCCGDSTVWANHTVNCKPSRF